MGLLGSRSACSPWSGTAELIAPHSTIHRATCTLLRMHEALKKEHR